VERDQWSQSTAASLVGWKLSGVTKGILLSRGWLKVRTTPVQ